MPSESLKKKIVDLFTRIMSDHDYPTVEAKMGYLAKHWEILVERHQETSPEARSGVIQAINELESSISFQP